MHNSWASVNDSYSCSPPASGIQLCIPAALNRPTHTLYSLCMAVQPTAQEWIVNRRYSQFLQLKKDVLNLLTMRGGCPGCASFARAIQKFAFPNKALLRTNSIIRKRVAALQLFIRLLVERVFNDLPKCTTCDERVKKIIRPFLIRGAQPMGNSSLARIQHSLSLYSYALVPIPKLQKAQSTNPNPDDSYSSTRRSNSEISMELYTSSVTYPPSMAANEEWYERQYSEGKCQDPAVPLEDAVKQVVMPGGLPTSYEELVFRLSTMWDAYEGCDKIVDDTTSQSSLTEEE